MQQYLIPLLLTFLAGLSTLIGGIFSFVIKRDNMKFLSIGLAFSAGVMIFLSLTELLNTSTELLTEAGEGHSLARTYISFFAGIAIAILIDYFVPDHIEPKDLEGEQNPKVRKSKIKRAGLMTALAIAVHNFPEGIATFFVSAQSITLGVPIALAIAIHNIPEGIAVALPIYHATGKRRKAIKYAFFSGMAEPLGAILGLLFLQQFFSQALLGYIFAIVAGIMIYISLDTLLPLAREYGENHHVMIGIVFGMLFISASLVIF